MGIQETEYDIKIDRAAPTPCKWGTKRIKLTMNPMICNDPMKSSSRDLPKIFNREIVFVAIAKGKIATESIINNISPETYSVPISESTNLEETSSKAIIGAVRLIPILMLPEVKSFWAMEDAGITIYAVLEISPPATTLIINEM